MSNARKRKERNARKQTKLQKEAKAWNKKCCYDVQLVRAEFVPKDLIDITPNRLIGDYK